MHILVAGWFSFEDMGATAGDLMACDVLCRWLDSRAYQYDVAFVAPFGEGVHWWDTSPDKYSHVCFVCGPFGNGWPITDFLTHFSRARMIGLNLTLLQTLDEWNPFDVCYERDSQNSQRPDITFAANLPKVPLVGIILAHKQKEYGSKSRHAEVDVLIKSYADTKHVTRIPIDTCLGTNAGGLRTSNEIESLIAKMDLVITTRLHGLVLSIKNGVPAIAIDAIEGGAKVSKQAEAIQWPIVIAENQLSTEALDSAFDYCTSAEARTKALGCAARAELMIQTLSEEFLNSIGNQHPSTK